jgi:hypothetical protein
MDRKYGLDELKRLAMSASGHVELVELARVHSPNQTRKLAETAHWGSRQARSARFLAMLRRDYGEVEFTTFLTTMEQERTTTVTAPVQDNRRKEMTESSLARNLDRVKDPIAKFRLCVKKSLVPQAREALESILASHGPMFWMGYETGEVLLQRHNDDGSSKRNEVSLMFVRPGEEQVSLAVNLMGMIEFFDMSDEDVRGVITQVITPMLAKEPDPQHHLMITATIDICRQYLSADVELLRQVELWVLCSRFREGRLFELRSTVLVTKMDSAEDECRELDPIIDRMVDLGMSMEEVRAEFMSFISKGIKNSRPQFALILVCAKCFKYDDQELQQLLVESYRAKLWQDVVNSNGDWLLEIFYKMGNRLFLNDKDRQEFFRRELSKLLSEGKLNRVWQLLLCIGHNSRLFYAEMHGPTFSGARSYLEKLVPESFARAHSDGQFGIAAALSQQFGADACHMDEVEPGLTSLELAHLALDAEMPIRFEDTEAYYVAPSWPRH